MEKKDYLRYGLYAAVALLIAFVVYLLLKPAKKPTSCAAGFSPISACGGKCGPSDCPAGNVNCNDGGLFAQCNCLAGQVYCKNSAGKMGCFDAKTFQCPDKDKDLLCVNSLEEVCLSKDGTGAYCCNRSLGCDTDNGGCANCAAGNRCGPGACCGPLEQCELDANQQPTGKCCDKNNYIAGKYAPDSDADKSDKCCATAGTTDGGTTWKYTTKETNAKGNPVRVCCDDDRWDANAQKCGVVCSGATATPKKICTDGQICDATPYASDASKPGLCITPGCTWGPLTAYPEDDSFFNDPGCASSPMYLKHCVCTGEGDCGNCSPWGSQQPPSGTPVPCNGIAGDKQQYVRYLGTPELSDGLCTPDDCEKRVATEEGVDVFSLVKDSTTQKTYCTGTGTADKDCACCTDSTLCPRCPKKNLRNSACTGLPSSRFGKYACAYGDGCEGDVQQVARF